ncbi:MAG: hypothetical protein H0W88_09750 [Parachlamydiaceae bacterium]|nr:hypothetical protein [Parachlamydiaceae bacterium]
MELIHFTDVSKFNGVLDQLMAVNDLNELGFERVGRCYKPIKTGKLSFIVQVCRWFQNFFSSRRETVILDVFAFIQENNELAYKREKDIKELGDRLISKLNPISQYNVKEVFCNVMRTFEVINSTIKQSAEEVQTSLEELEQRKAQVASNELKAKARADEILKGAVVKKNILIDKANAKIDVAKKAGEDITKLELAKWNARKEKEAANLEFFKQNKEKELLEIDKLFIPLREEALKKGNDLEIVCANGRVVITNLKQLVDEIPMFFKHFATFINIFGDKKNKNHTTGPIANKIGNMFRINFAEMGKFGAVSDDLMNKLLNFVKHNILLKASLTKCADHLIKSFSVSTSDLEKLFDNVNESHLDEYENTDLRNKLAATLKVPIDAIKKAYGELFKDFSSFKEGINSSLLIESIDNFKNKYQKQAIDKLINDLIKAVDTLATGTRENNLEDLTAEKVALESRKSKISVKLGLEIDKIKAGSQKRINLEKELYDLKKIVKIAILEKQLDIKMHLKPKPEDAQNFKNEIAELTKELATLKPEVAQQAALEKDLNKFKIAHKKQILFKEELNEYVEGTDERQQIQAQIDELQPDVDQYVANKDNYKKLEVEKNNLLQLEKEISNRLTMEDELKALMEMDPKSPVTIELKKLLNDLENGTAKIAILNKRINSNADTCDAAINNLTEKMREIPYSILSQKNCLLIKKGIAKLSSQVQNDLMVFQKMEQNLKDRNCLQADASIEDIREFSFFAQYLGYTQLKEAIELDLDKMPTGQKEIAELEKLSYERVSKPIENFPDFKVVSVNEKTTEIYWRIPAKTPLVTNVISDTFVSFPGLFQSPIENSPAIPVHHGRIVTLKIGRWSYHQDRVCIELHGHANVPMVAGLSYDYKVTLGNLTYDSRTMNNSKDIIIMNTPVSNEGALYYIPEQVRSQVTADGFINCKCEIFYK